MVDNNHSWLSIQEYTLSEIGAFLHSIVKRESQVKADRISEYWFGSNLTKQGLQELTEKLHRMAGVEKAEPTIEEINNDWKRLAAFMQGIR